ncbi:hypothetical protein [Pontibacter mangrovi]|uniref:Uncharacterized protein n=1 Tax=Pontibacter mangrovi TaxID=2589816 RepID=A0A501VZB4_9BACT|nr:hypothetical protein [Pontibacter mangrovi]TPE43083.1 hypothetical protein FJM65_15705 [Pontibacter mangrovi]
MKNLLLFVSILFISTSAFAQSGHMLSRESEQKCTQITRNMAQELRLNELGYIKLKEINKERMRLTEEAVNSYADNHDMLNQKLEEIARNYDEKITAFLNPNQLQAYANYKKAQPAGVRFASLGAE